MKVAVSFPGCHRRGGVERIVLECARFLAGRGHEVIVYANEWEAESAPTLNYQYVPMQKRPGFMHGPSYFRQCTRLLRSQSYDILNTHGCVCPLGGVHWVQSVHGAWLECSKTMRGRLSSARLKQWLNPLHPLLLSLERRHFRERNYRKVITTTPDVSRDLQRFYGVPEEDMIVVPNGFSPTEFNPERRLAGRESMRARLGLRKDEVVLLFVANELERKGYRTILGALARLRNPNLRLLVVGRPDVETVRQQAAMMGVAESVIACGPTSDVASYHAAADLFVLPTQYEAFCLAILEALGSGLPVITSRVPGAYDAIQPCVNGALITDPKSGDELADALEPFLERQFRERISAQVSDSVRQYQWPTVLERYEEILVQCA